MNRRHFVRNSLLASASLNTLNLLAASGRQSHDIALFTKPFQHMSYSEFSDTIKEIGATSVELPVRPKGHIEPSAVVDKLPKMVAELKKRDLRVSILASGINSIDSKDAEKTLKTAAAMGIKQYRMSYFKYDFKKSIPAQLNEIRAKLKDLVAMNREIGIQGIYQNHSGKNYFGSPLWDVYTVFKDFDKKDLGIGFDIGHATAEGGKSWPIQQKLLEDRIAAVYIKDPLWQNKKMNWVPLGEGQVKKEFFDKVQASGFKGTYSLHVEYLDHRKKENLPKFIEAFKQDVKTLKQMLGS
ncbi:MAG: sugar phosphate isomerase/epimerase [Lentisphaeraceae bacterium]|nr:sugar phosphate isomerase/epimerase [Lentisphaeraceae bacterium]